MNLKERLEIEIRLKEKESIRSISRKLNKNATTIIREIKNRKKLLKNNKVIVLNKKSDDEILLEHPCSILKKSPYVCNGCNRYIKNTCSYHYVVYKAEEAQIVYENLKRESNSKIQKEDLVKTINELLELGQPISHIYLSLKEKYNKDMVSITSIYKWIEKDYLKYNKNKIKKKRDNIQKEKIEYKKRIDFLKDKEYENFLDYTKNNRVNIVEMDLVCGRVNTSGYILTIFIPSIQFLMAYKLENKTPQEVLRVLDDIENKIGFSTFKKMFSVILTDRGSEFLKYNELCYSKRCLKERCKIFYCDAGKPTQKAYIENIHRLLRRVYPKGINLEGVKQEDLYEVVSNINSLKKKNYNNKSPNELFIDKYGKTVLNKLSLRAYLPNEVVLLKNT